MKTFKDLKFEKHERGNGLKSRILFDNGYGVSVIRFKSDIDIGREYATYTDNESEWELAVIKRDKETDKWELCYDTPIASDVLGFLTEDDVTEIMRQVQELKG